ncbi:MAG: hypothetical protein ACTH2Y_08455 [Corynebacterium sp.]|uniref:hypothetical protein n=1 Tax=Corynebacterium sp. TaxID=1720 RepID=UPI003F90C4EC
MSADNGLGTLLVLLVPILVYTIAQEAQRMIHLIDPADDDRPLTDEERSDELVHRARARARRWRYANKHRARRGLEDLEDGLDIRREAWTACRSVHPDSQDPLRRSITLNAQRYKRAA